MVVDAILKYYNNRIVVGIYYHKDLQNIFAKIRNLTELQESISIALKVFSSKHQKTIGFLTILCSRKISNERKQEFLII